MSKERRPRIPGYRIHGVWGEGAMATVYRATHRRLQKSVALKVLHDGVAKDPDYRQRFLREARAAAKLNHRNVVRAYEAGEDDGAFWFAMEFVDGDDLGEAIANAGRLPETEALRIGIEVARALEAAEEHGMVHRDVKPENVLLGEGGSVKLADLGLAKVQGDGSITAEGYTLGTVAFFSPEQCKGATNLDIRSDLWALGALLFTAMSGDLPYGRGENPVLTMRAILEEEPPEIADLVELSPTTVSAVRALMTKNRTARPQTASDAVALLENALARVGQPAESARAPSTRRRGRSRRGQSSANLGAGRRSSSPPLGFVVSGVVSLCMVIGVFMAMSGSPSASVAVSPTPTARPSASVKPRPRPSVRPSASVKPRPRPSVAVVPSPRPSRPAVETMTPALISPVDRTVGPAVDRPTATPSPRPVAPIAVDFDRARGLLHATTVKQVQSGGDWSVELQYGFAHSGELQDWSQQGGELEVVKQSLRFGVLAKGEGTLELRPRLLLPVEIRYSVRVTTRSMGKRGLLWTTLGPGPGTGHVSFGGASLYELNAGEPVLVAGRKNPRSIFSGSRKQVRIRFESGRATGYVNDKEMYSHAVSIDPAIPLRLALHIAAGVAIDVRDLTVVGRLDPVWARGAQ